MTRPMTIAEKILAAHAGLNEVKPGQLISAKLDITLANDITGPVAIKEFKKIGVEKVFNKERVVFVPDHFVPNKDIKSAQQAKMVREFSKEQNLKNYFEVGRMGIEHALLPEKGIVTAGDLIIGADSHTCTYGALGAFSTGVGSTDLACAMVSGETWFKVPSTIKVEFNGKLNKWVSAKDLILHLIGDIGVDGALYKVLEIGGSAIQEMEMDGRLTICNMAIEAGAKAGIIVPDAITKEYLKNRSLESPYITQATVTQNMKKCLYMMFPKLSRQLHSLICLKTPSQFQKWET
ncbi:MAG: aconitase family protein [Candidatus Gastranaerophilaceae bacterium]